MERIQEYQDERWKERARQIRNLDGNKCAMCGKKGILHVHHLSYPPAPFHIWDCRDDELVTLCPECHKKVHASITRVHLDVYRNVIGYYRSQREINEAMNFDEWKEYCEKVAEETKKKYDDQLKKEFEKINAARDSGCPCCANCIHGSWGGEFGCNIDGGDDEYITVDPYDSCINHKYDE